MNNQTEKIVRNTIQFLYQQFKQQLRINSILKQTPKMTANTTNKLVTTLLQTSQLEQPKKNSNLFQQNMPTSIKTQNISNFGVQIQMSSELLSFSDNISQKNIQKIENQSLKSRKKSFIQSKSTFRYSQTKMKQEKQNQQNKKQQNQKIIGKSNLVGLNLNEENNDQQLEKQIQKVKKHLYIMRRYRKQNIDEERKGIQKLMKRKSPQIPKNEHTYEYDGQAVKINKLSHSTSLVSQLKQKVPLIKKQQFKYYKNQKAKETDTFNFTNQFILQNNPERSSPSRQIQKMLFNNSNKRQTSHLPFINLGINMKIIENQKQISNEQSTRQSLNKSKFSERSNQNTFKHFSHIQFEKRLQQSIKKSSVNSFQKNQEQSQIGYNDQIILTKPQNRRQSKMMQKYLKKLAGQKLNTQKINSQQRKSVNFDKLKVPHQYPIQKYYKYNYNQDKIQFQTQLTSRKSSLIENSS